MLNETIRFKIAWIALTLIGVAIFIFGVIVTLWPGAQDTLFLRTIGVASVGMGLFGTLISAIPYRRRERWAWFALWYYPLFWLAHLLGNLPPGQDHVHQGRLHSAFHHGPAPLRPRIFPSCATSTSLI